MQPVGSSLLGELAGALTGGSLGGGGATIPAGRLPLVFFIWGPARITPVRLTSLTITETAFDELLNPIHASADLGFDRAARRPTWRRTTRSRGRPRPTTRARARSRPCCRCRSCWRRVDVAAPDPTSRYAGLPTIHVVAPDGSVRVLGAPRVVPRRATRGVYTVRAGDRLDLLAHVAARRLDALVAARRRQSLPRRDAARAAGPRRSSCPMPDTRLLIELDGEAVAAEDLRPAARGAGRGVRRRGRRR